MYHEIIGFGATDQLFTNTACALRTEKYTKGRDATSQSWNLKAYWGDGDRITNILERSQSIATARRTMVTPDRCYAPSSLGVSFEPCCTTSEIFYTHQRRGVLEATEITARRTAAASVAATNILYKKRHSLSNSSDEPIVLGIFGAGVQGKNHALAFHAAYSNISEIRIWNHRLPKAERLVAELKTLGINQARVARTGRECAEGADILVTATSSSEPILFDEWVKNGAHINAVGSGRFHYCELDLPLYRRVKIYLDNESSGRNELRGLVVQGISLITSVGNVFLEPNLMPGKQDITVFHSVGMAAEDALAAQLVYKRHLLSRPSN
ncbi:ketimine reductase mu-crystallin isoform X3 [Neodiprion fabricii]|uniref:ketimine reductase mu-crystallin isoform X3 n=1 Tax=Neodiprion fabricii TaxID=2872261 RepID=UPI001ED94C91|nr:ketimine reductase mu-crystallin isoform X3 [Neodiprion fabricii]